MHRQGILGEHYRVMGRNVSRGKHCDKPENVT